MRKLIIIIVGVIIPAGLIYAVYTGYNVVFEPNVNRELAPYSLFVEEGTMVEDVYEKFIEDGVLNTPEGFMIIAQRKGLKQPKPGHYILTEELSSNSLVNMFMAGLQTAVKVSFNAGSDLADVAGRLDDQLMADSASIYEALNMPRVGWEGPHALGAYLPNTYEMYWNASPENIANKLYQNTARFWTEERIAQANGHGMTPAEAATLASLVMKESSNREDRPKVARLYLNRLEKGMRLQCDPTVIFAIKRTYPDTTIRRVLRRDLTFDDPYNTYVYKGLPPGPICVPEEQALLAVLEAPEHDYLYMCADPSNPGYHAFAKNYAAHLLNQRKWTAYLNSRRIYR